MSQQASERRFELAEHDGLRAYPARERGGMYVDNGYGGGFRLRIERGAKGWIVREEMAVGPGGILVDMGPYMSPGAVRCNGLHAVPIALLAFLDEVRRAVNGPRQNSLKSLNALIRRIIGALEKVEHIR